MGSIRKSKKQAERKLIKEAEKARKKAIHDKEMENKRNKARLRKEVREALGFDKFRLKRKLVTSNPCLEIPLGSFWDN